MLSRLPTKITILLAAVVLLTSCQQSKKEYKDNFLAFGTLINVTLFDVDEQLANDSFRQIRDDFKLMHRSWHVWEPGPLKRTNQLLKTQAEFSVAPSVLELITIAKKLSAQSQYLFNPAIGELIALWGFHSHQHPETPPSDKAITQLLKQQPSMDNISIQGVRMKSNNAAVKVDLGGIAKGFALERVLAELKRNGVNNALINTGGDLKVIGQNNQRAWKVAIRDPRPQSKNLETNIVASIDLKDGEAAFTSGDYERLLKKKNTNDPHLHHIIDPRTGYPAEGTQSVTVLHANATLADAAATALFIAGPKQWVEIAKAMNIKDVLLIDTNGDIRISSTMNKRIKLQQKRKIIETIDL